MSDVRAPGQGPMIEALGVHKSYGQTEVLHGVDLVVDAGEVVALLGPSGSGKTTLLRCLNHLETVNAGIIRVNGRIMGYVQHGASLVPQGETVIARQRAETGMVFQRFNLFPHLSALQNVTLAPTVVKGIPRRAADARGRELLAKVGLLHKATAFPHELSGGQQQRVAIARALAMDPLVMLFDEPTSALDPELVGEVLQVIRDLATEGMTMVIVSHEVAFARDVADRAIVMVDGAIVEEGAASQVLTHPANPRTRQFLARILHPNGAEDVSAQGEP